MRLPVVALLVSLGCAVEDPAGGAPGGDGKADVTGDPVHGNSPYFWAATEYDLFKQAAQAPPFRVGRPLAEADQLTARLQAWADVIHDSVADEVLRTTGEPLVAPRPIVKILPSKQANAWVSGIPICLTGEADLSGIGPARPARTAKLMFLEHDRVREAISLFGAPRPKCIDAASWPSLPDAIAFYNASGTRCRIETSGGKLAVSGDGCGIDPTGPTSAQQLTYYATSPYIHFTTAFLALAEDETSVVGTLTHELGHYYRSHVVSDVVMGRYDYWYVHTDPVETPPRAAADSDAIETRFREVLPFPRPEIAGQKISYRLTDATLHIGGLLAQAAAATPGFACADAVARLEGDWQDEFNGIGAAFVHQATADAYLAFESSLLACAGDIPVTAAGGAGELALSAVREVIRREADDVAGPEVEAGTLAQVLGTLNQRAAVLDRAVAEFRAGLASRRLGNYTAEQEADDVSLGFYARVGLDPQVRIDTYFDLLRQHPDLSDPGVFAGRNGGLSLAECAALQAADWMVDGERVYVPLGNLHDSHHGDCYRWFNLTQQQRAHDHRPSGKPPALGVAWSALRAEAKRVTDAFTPGGPAHAIDPGVDPEGPGIILE
jgi:hypothetical protein